MKICRLLFVLVLLLFLFTGNIFADSSYVLPYPSSMPGSLLYKIHTIQEKLEEYWYFGDYGKFKYYLKYSDRYLVEAKVLFEYKQYLLGYKALVKSDNYYKKIKPVLTLAQKNNKNIKEKSELLREAGKKHIEELADIEKKLPETFNWNPEKSSPTLIPLKNAIENSIKTRE